MATLKDIISTTDAASAKFDHAVKASEIKMLDEAITLIKGLETNSKGNIATSVENLKKVQQIKTKLYSIANNKEYLKAVRELVDTFDKIYSQQLGFYSMKNGDSATDEKYKLTKQIARENTIKALTGDGLSSSVTSKLDDMLLTAVTTGAKYSDLQKQFAAYLASDDGGGGALSRYATTYSVTALSQYTGQNNKLFTDDLGTDWFEYAGSEIETTRPFCAACCEKRYIHRSEFRELLKGHIHVYKGGAEKIIDVPIYEKTKLPQGMIEGTTEDNLQVNCGGWNCRHQLVPIAAAAVPEDIRKRFASTAPDKSAIKPEPEKKKVAVTEDAPLPKAKVKKAKFTGYGFDDPNEALLWLYGKTKGVPSGALSKTETLDLLYEFKKRYDFDSTSSAESALKGLLNHGDVFKYFNSSFDTGSGLYNIHLERKQVTKYVEVDDAKLAATKAEADVVLKRVSGLKGLGAEDIEKAIATGDEAAIKKATDYAVYKEAAIKGLTTFENPLELAKKFTYDELIDVATDVEDTIKSWGSISDDRLKGKIEYKIHGVGVDKNSRTWELYKAAYEKKLVDVNKRLKLSGMIITINDMLADAESYCSMKPDEKLQKLITNAKRAAAIGDEFSAMSNAKNALKYYESISEVSGTSIGEPESVKKETLTEMKKRLGDSMPKTLTGLQERINHYEMGANNVAERVKKNKAVIESVMRDVFDKHDFGMHVKSKYLLKILDSWFKNQFETGTSDGAIDNIGDLSVEQGGIPEGNIRLVASSRMFGNSRRKSEQFQRGEYEKYGSLLDHDILRSITSPQSETEYGDVEVRFKKSKVICTWTPFDSLWGGSDGIVAPSLTSDPHASTFDGYGNFAPVDNKSVGNLIEFKKQHIASYIELQYHGKFTPDCVESLAYPYDLSLPHRADKLKTALKWRAIGVKVYYWSNGKLVELVD